MVLREETFEYYMYSFIFPYEIQNFISECNILTTIVILLRQLKKYMYSLLRLSVR